MSSKYTAAAPAACQMLDVSALFAVSEFIFALLYPAPYIGSVH